MPDWKSYIRQRLPRERFRGESEGEILEELATHLEDVYSAALARGASPQEAEEEAQGEVPDWDRMAASIVGAKRGAGVSRTEEAMEASEIKLRARGGRWASLSDALQELRFTLRRLRKTPGYTVVVLMTLALGIGATTAIFSVVKSVLLDPLPFEDADELVGIWNTAPGMGEDQLPQSLAFNAVYSDDARSLVDVGVWTMTRSAIQGPEGPVELMGMRVTEGVFSALRVQPVLGRAFTFEDTQTGSPLTIILAHGYWKDAFGGDGDVLGQTLDVGGFQREVIGVMPEGFTFMDRDPAFYLPLRYSKASLSVSNFVYQSVGRMAPGVSIPEAVTDLNRLVQVAPARYPGGMTREILENAEGRALLHPLKEDIVGDVGGILWVVLGGVSIILLVAVGNVGNLYLVRAESRDRETAIQAALGSPRRRIVAQHLTETLVLASVGGLLGLALAHAGLEFLKATGPGDLPRLHEIGLDGQVMVFTLILSVVTGVVLALLPLLRSWKVNLVDALKEGGQGSGRGRGRNRTRNVLVVGQLALALILLVGSGLMIRSFFTLTGMNPGFSDPEKVLTFRLGLGPDVVPDDEEVAAAHQQMAQRLAEISGVTSVGLSSSVPMDGRWGYDPIFFEDFPLQEGQMPQIRRFKWVGGNYPETLGNDIVAGRSISWDDIQNRARVVMITEGMAREAWGDPSRAVGRRIATGQAPGDWREIVGVVGDVRDDGMEHDPVDIVYWPMVLEGFWGGTLFVSRGMGYAIRSQRVGTPEFAREVRDAVWSAYPREPLGAMVTMDSLQQGSMARTSFTLVMLAIAASVALLLGSIGIYGVISYTVGQRTQELGLRMAMGAEGGRVVAMVLRQGLTLTVVGLGLGIGGALVVTRLMSALLFGVSPTDPLTYGVVAVVLVVVASLATYLPARRAAGVDPMVALRAE